MKTLVLGSALFTLVLTAFAPSPSQAATCEDFLDNNIYSCTFKFEEDPESFETCIGIQNPGELSQKFDLYFPTAPIYMGCSCDPTGNPSNPKFNASTSFHCAGDSFDGPIALSGKATPQYILGRGEASSPMASLSSLSAKLTLNASAGRQHSSLAREPSQLSASSVNVRPDVFLLSPDSSRAGSQSDVMRGAHCCCPAEGATLVVAPL